MSDHAVFSPSGFALLMQGAGCWELDAMFPDTDSEAAREGTAAHWVWDALRQVGIPCEVGTLAPNGVPVTKEMIEGGREYLNYLFKVLNPYGVSINSLAVRHEQHMQIPFLHPTLCSGTPDSRYYHVESRHLHIFDYKFGFSFVDAIMNWQLIGYAAGAIYDTEVLHNGQPTQITLHVVQPRCYHAESICRSWTISWEQLHEYIGQLRQRIQEASRGNGPCNTGEGCRNCNGRHACQSLRLNVAASAEYTRGFMVEVLPPDALGVELQIVQTAIERMKARETGLIAMAEAEMEQGHQVNGFVIGRGRSTTIWNHPPEAIIEMAKLYDVNVAKPPEAITPKQAEALLPSEVVAELSRTIPGAKKVKREDTNKARSIFGR